MTDKEALDILNEAFSWEDFLEAYFDERLRDAVTIAVRALAEKVAREGE